MAAASDQRTSGASPDQLLREAAGEEGRVIDLLRRIDHGLASRCGGLAADRTPIFLGTGARLDGGL